PIFYAIPGVKGVEFGNGFTATTLMGSENNDDFFSLTSDGNIVTATNNHGGFLGGITTGMPIIARLAFKPTPSIGKAQYT
ncbi:chorismate synthase, partial [Acinetobacter baumannii]|nr:chorismate synthase [Acinetobacter baumannii]